jgi:hypothetical protein
MRYKNIYFKEVTRDKLNKRIVIECMHKNGYKFEVIKNNHDIMVYDIIKDRVILEERATLKHALKDVNAFYNHRELKYKMF